jgi:putative toxin-antitoxin system antitoxin component (TIGR02293 family)
MSNKQEQPKVAHSRRAVSKRATKSYLLKISEKKFLELKKLLPALELDLLSEKKHPVALEALNKALLNRIIGSSKPQLRVNPADGLSSYTSLPISHITDFARKVLGDEERAMRWLTKPNPSLNNQVPLSLAKTKVGVREVETVLKRIAYGDYS